MKGTLPDRARFGVFELDLKAGELHKGGQTVLLQEQPLQVLRMLVVGAGELVTREEIQKKLWPNDTVVEFDHGINTAIQKLRQALGDSADKPSYIQTVARRGYRLMVPVEWVEQLSVVSGQLAERPVAAAVQTPVEAAILSGRTVSHHRVLEIIGGGGMGVVYRAEDLKLGRQVALKFLPEELGSEPQALERFSREARAASSLDHPNICPIYEFGEHEGRPFMVMQLLQGQTLRDRLAAVERGLPLAEVLDIGIQVSDGLQAAHEKGIIHRDIKPANIFLTSKGVIKILDFGVAKLVASAEAAETPADLSSRAEVAAATGVEGSAVCFGFRTADPSTARPLVPQQMRDGEERGRSAQDDSIRVVDATLTRTGLAMGTAGYMSPEQVRGEKLDARTDIFSFGLVLYEMSTGQRAFTGETAAVVHDAILNSSPNPARELNPALPPRFVTTINKALEKDRRQRYQSAAEMRAALKQLNTKNSRTVLTPWKWYAAAALLIAAVVAGSLYRRARKTVKLTQTDTIVLAHVVNNTGDTVIDDALDYPLLRKVAESPYITVLYPSKVVDTLRLMKVPNISYIDAPQTPKLTPELAREVCVRSDSRAFVTAYIANTGNAYNIALNALDCHSGKTLAKVERQTNDRNQIVKTLGAAGYQLRRQVGEPEDSLTRFNTPLENETSWSLESLQALSQAQRLRAEQSDAVALPQYKRAVELDPNLVVAYLNLAGIYYQSGESPLAASNATTAFNLRDRLSQRSRWFVEAVYYDVTGELEKANATYIQWEQTFPADVNAHKNRTDSLDKLGQLEQATAEAREEVRLLPNVGAYTKLLGQLLFTDRLEEAKVIFEEARARGIDGLSLREERYLLAFLQGDNRAMQEQISWAMAIPEGKTWALLQPGDIATYHGRFRAAQNLYSVAQSYSHWPAASPPDEVLSHTALVYAETGNPVRARQAAEHAVSAGPNSTSKGLVALILARAGAVEEAESIAKSLDQEFPPNTLVQNFELPAIRAAIELHRGQPARAIEILQSALPYDFALPADSFEPLYPAYLRGLAYLHLGRSREAAVEFQKIVDHPGIVQDLVTAPLSRMQLARVQVMMGDKAAARNSYQDFLTLWKDADPDIPIYRQAKAEYAKLRRKEED
jgi:serine/threonine protein kinase/DNA-binding winged helix-turn-helix (wHTH) protein/tetratricopeptide (TPR) repeat protein